MPRFHARFLPLLLTVIMLLSSVLPAVAETVSEAESLPIEMVESQTSAEPDVSGEQVPETIEETIDSVETSPVEITEESTAVPSAEPTTEASTVPSEAPTVAPEETSQAVVETEAAEMPMMLMNSIMQASVKPSTFDSSLLNGIPATANPGSGTTKWGTSSGCLCSGNQGKSYSSSTLTLTMTTDAKISFEYKVSTEASYDKFTIKHNSTTKVNGVSGTIDWTALSIDAKSGDTITFTYKKDSSGDGNDDTVYLRNFSAGEAIVVSFNANGGSGEMDDQNFYGTANLRANTFTKDHAVFVGWSEKAGGEVKYADGESIDKPSESMTLYAVWADAWVLTFADADKTVTVKKGDSLGAENIPSVSRNGYKQDGWYCGETKLNADAAVNADATYTAKWTPIVYTVKFDANGGTGVMDEITVCYDQTVNLPKAIFARDGYTFSKWTDGGVRSYDDEAQILNLSSTDAASVTLKAQWVGNKVTVHIDPNYEGAAVTDRIGVVGSNYNYIYNEESGSAKFSELPDATRDGYKFTGWFASAEGDTEITNQYKFTAEDEKNGITLYAHWVEAVTVTFDANGGTCSTASRIIAKGEKIGYLPTAKLTNQNFTGWFTAAEGGEQITAETIPTENLTVYAQYHKNSYYVEFYPNNATGAMEKVYYEFGTSYTLPVCTFIREDYTFSGWSTSSWSSTVKYADGAPLNRSFDSWDNEDGEIFKLYAVWKETVYATAFNAIEKKLPTGNTVRATGALNLPASGTGWTAAYTSDDATMIDGCNVIALPATGSKVVTITATVTDASTNLSKSRQYAIALLSAEAVEAENTLKTVSSALPYKVTPVYGTDTNLNDCISALIKAKGYDGVTVSVKEEATSYDTCSSVDADGTIHYYFNPNMTGSGSNFYVTVNLSLNGATVEKKVYVSISWDLARAQKTLNAELERVAIPEEITENDLTTLPKYTIKEGVDAETVDYSQYTHFNTWATTTWTSSDEQRISIGAAPSYPYYSPYAVTVTPTTKAQTVALTATMTANSISGLTATKTFNILVKPVDEDPRDVLQRELGKKLDAALQQPGLTDAVTGKALDTSNVVNDIHFPTTRDIGVDGKYQPVTITSSDESVIKTYDVNNAARVQVYRPLAGEDAKEVTLTITITDKETGVTASRDIVVTVQPLSDDEIDAELALMEQVKAHYFDGIKNANTNPNEITTDLHPFAEAYSDNGEIVWVYSNSDMRGNGIVPVAMDGWEAEESWRAFRSSNGSVISHENLLVTRDKENKTVTVTSWLSSEKYGKYAEMYPNDARFAKLTKQPVSATLIVLGTNPSDDNPKDTKFNVKFTLRDNNTTWFSVKYSDIEEGATVFDVFRRALSDNGYTSEGGKFVTGISGKKGTLRNLDRGEYSGWMYSVNGATPDKLMNEYYLSSDAKIVFYFTDDYRSSSMDDTTKTEEAQSASGTAKNFEDIYKTTGDYIQGLDASELCSFGSEWPIFALKRSERDLLELYANYFTAAETYVSENIDEHGRLDENRVTENLRLIITLSALEDDVTNVAGYDLLTALSDLEYVEKQGLSGAVYTLLAIQGSDYEIPEAAKGTTQTTEEALLKYILERQLSDGGWDYSNQAADPDMTAMALQALAFYYVENPVTAQDKTVKEAVERGIACLSALQDANGNYASYGTVNAESAAQVIIALTAYGIDPHTDSRFVKNNTSVLDSLCSFYVLGGGFRHTQDDDRNALATVQGYCALTAYWRFKEEKTPLYDMSDLTALQTAA